MNWSSPLFAALATETAKQAESTGRALMLWLILAAGLVVFLLVLVLVSLTRRREERKKRAESAEPVDAWKTSAERLQTPPLADDDEQLS